MTKINYATRIKEHKQRIKDKFMTLSKIDMYEVIYRFSVDDLTESLEDLIAAPQPSVDLNRIEEHISKLSLDKCAEEILK